MTILQRKLNRPIRKAQDTTKRRPLRKAVSQNDKDITEFVMMLNNIGASAEEAAKELEKIQAALASGDTESVLTRLDVVDEEIAYNIKEAVKTLLDEEGGDGIGDLINRLRDEAGGGDVEAAAKPRFTKRAERRPLRKAGDVDIDEMLNGYMEAALWSSTDESDESGGEPLDKNYTVNDINDETKAQMRKDCAAFVQKAGDLLDKAKEKRPDYIGHNFWLSRNGHGAGFFDTPDKWGGDENADALQEVASSFGEFYLSADGDAGISGYGG